jgi:hypothetical protein
VIFGRPDEKSQYFPQICGPHLKKTLNLLLSTTVVSEVKESPTPLYASQIYSPSCEIPILVKCNRFPLTDFCPSAIVPLNFRQVVNGGGLPMAAHSNVTLPSVPKKYILNYGIWISIAYCHKIDVSAEAYLAVLQTVFWVSQEIQELVVEQSIWAGPSKGLRTSQRKFQS